MEYQALKFKRLSSLAQLPKRGSSYAAGLDLVSVENVQILPQNRALISTGWSLQVPQNHYGRVAPRSGLALKNGIDVGAGVIDSDYRGELKVLLFNFGNEIFNVQVGDRIAQLIIEKILMCTPIEVNNLDESERNEAGFGSTGIGNQNPLQNQQEIMSQKYDQIQNQIYSQQNTVQSQQQMLQYQQQSQQQASQQFQQLSSQQQIQGSQQYY